MSGRIRGSGKMIRLADRLYGSKKRSMGIALGIAGVSYVLALIFGGGAPAIVSPVIGLICFGGIFLVLGTQLINPFCPPGVMDFAELFVGLFYGVFGIFWFLTKGFWQLFGDQAAEAVVTICMYAGIWCAVCVIHNMRK